MKTIETEINLEQHDPDKHWYKPGGKVKGHSQAWYGVWGDKCPTCGIKPEFGQEEVK